MSFITVFIIISTMTTSTSLILCNKYLMSTYNFNWPISLSVYHFLITYFLLEVMRRLRFFDSNDELPVFSKWLMGFYNSTSIVLMNFNLKFNSIGFYQLSKLTTIPIMVIINFFLYNKKTPLKTLASLAILLFGLYLFSVNDVQFNILGCLFALGAVLTTTASQLYNGQLQKEYSISGTTLQHQTAFPQAILAFISAIYIEMYGVDSILYHSFLFSEALFAIGTGLLAVGSNVSAFAIIGRTSAITYQVIGHAKTLIIFVFGLILFPPSIPEPKDKMKKKMLGLLFGMIGTILYTIFEMADKNKSQHEQIGQNTDNRIGVDVEFEAVSSEENQEK